MLEYAFNKLYTNFKLHFYKSVFGNFQAREASLTTVETFCMEIIYAMDKPTINEFASFIQISSPNAAYKVNSLIKKGYIKKVQSEDDKREYHLEVTDKYLAYYNISYAYVKVVMERIKDRFNDNELKTMEKILQITADELMPELDGLKRKESE